MTMTFHKFNWAMVVMDDRRAVAKGRRLGWGEWVVHIVNGSWLDVRATRKKMSIPDIPDSGIFDPSRMVVKNKREAEKVLKSLILQRN